MLKGQPAQSGPGIFSGAHHQSFENTEFRAAGRDMYHGTTVNVHITTPRSSSAGSDATAASTSVVVGRSPFPASVQRPRNGRRLWRVARFLRSGHGPDTNQVSQEEIQSQAADGTSSAPSAATALSPVQVSPSASCSSMDDDFSMSSIESVATVSVDLQELSNAEIYVRSLSCSKGLACWQPKPLRSLSGIYGISPGDVGTFTAEDGFKRMFNLWEDTLSIRASGNGDHGQPYQPPRNDLSHHEHKLQEGDTVVHGAITDTVVSVAEDGSRQTSSFEFRCQSQQGAVLALTSSADLVEAVHQKALRNCIVQHAGLLYRHAESIRLLDDDESLYIVTGCMKSDSWALAAYKDPMESPDDILRLVQIGWSNTPNRLSPIYAWTKRGTSEARCGESAEGRCIKNQTLFMRGFKLAFSHPFRERMKRDNPANLDASDPENREGTSDPKPSQSRGANGGGGFPGGRTGGWYSGGGSASGQPSDSEGVQLETFPENSSEVYHICDSINNLLLAKTGADFALSHDDDWRLRERRFSTWNEFVQTVLCSILWSQSIRLDHGVAFVDSEAPPTRREDVLFYIFLRSDDAPVLRNLDARFGVEILRYPVNPDRRFSHWHPPVEPLRERNEECPIAACVKSLVSELAVRDVQRSNSFTVVSYHNPRELDGRLGILPELHHTSRSLFEGPQDYILVVLSSMWHFLRCWDVSLERLSCRIFALVQPTIPPNRLDPHELESVAALQKEHVKVLCSKSLEISHLPACSCATSGHSRGATSWGHTCGVSARKTVVNQIEELASLREERRRLQSIVFWQGTEVRKLEAKVASLRAVVSESIGGAQADRAGGASDRPIQTTEAREVHDGHASRDGPSHPSPLGDDQGRIWAKQTRPCTRCKNLKVRCEQEASSGACRRCSNGGHECVRTGRRLRVVPPKRSDLIEKIQNQAKAIERLMKNLDLEYEATAPTAGSTLYERSSPSTRWSVSDDTLLDSDSLSPTPSKRHTITKNKAVQDWIAKIREGMEGVSSMIGNLKEDQNRFADPAIDVPTGGDDTELIRNVEVGSISCQMTPPIEDSTSIPLDDPWPNILTPGKRARGEGFAIGSFDVHHRPSVIWPASTHNMLGMQERAPLIVTRGLISAVEAKVLFNIFYTEMNTSVSLLDPKLSGIDHMYWRSPFLFTVVCAVASRYYVQRPELYPLAMQCAQLAAGDALVTGDKDVYTCAAYILLSLYPAPVKSLSEERSWLYLGLAIRIATDVNLHLPRTADPRNENQMRQILNRTRVWLNCFNLDRSSSIQHGKPPMIPTNDYTALHVESWWNSSPHSLQGFDIHIAAYTEALKLTSCCLAGDGSNPDLHIVSSKDARFEGLAAQKDDELQRLQEKWFSLLISPNPDPHHFFRRAQLKLQYSYARLAVLSHGFRYTAGQNVERLKPLVARVISAATDAINALQDMSTPLGNYLQRGPEEQSVIPTFASSLLIKLLQPRFSLGLSDGQRTKIERLVQRTIELLSGIALDDNHTPKLYSLFLVGLLSERHTANPCGEPGGIPSLDVLESYPGIDGDVSTTEDQGWRT